MALQITPTPSGQIPVAEEFITGSSGNFQQDLDTIIRAMLAKGDTDLANKFRIFALQYHATHPTLTAREVLQAYLDELLTGALTKGLGTATSALGKIPGAAAQGAQKAFQDIFHGFNLGNWFLRIGEILLGLVLVGVGIARMTGVQNKISELVKTRLPI